MPGYLICEDGPLAEWVFTFDEGDQWIIGRDGDLCTFVLEDPMVSRKHLTVFFNEDAYFIENESSTNPALLNDQAIETRTKINEDDLVQIGNNIFRFTTTAPLKKEETENLIAEENNEPKKDISLTLGKFPIEETTSSKWMIKVISGPASGAQFALHAKETYVLGSDSASSDILLHDLSISKNHARITLTEDNQAAIIDLNSRNGVFVNGRKIDSDTILKPQDLITIGTTSILFIDIENTRDTIYSPGIPQYMNQESSLFSDDKEEKKKEETKHWKDTFIPTKHLAIASVFSVFICIGIISILALFRSTQVKNFTADESEEIKKNIGHFEDVIFNYNRNTSTLFLSGHVLTDIDYNELLYRLKNIPYISDIEDNVIIDEAVYENMNALLLKNPIWQSILMTARQPGEFILTGYIKTENEKAELTDYINKHFNYLNLLKNQVVVEDTLNTQIENLLLSKGFTNVLFQQNNGRLVLSGRAHLSHKKDFDNLIKEINAVHGIRIVKNFVIFTSTSSVAIDITSKYNVTGSSKFGNKNQFVLINGRILGVNDKLDGMIITKILNKEVLLKKEGVKYKIDFNE